MLLLTVPFHVHARAALSRDGVPLASCSMRMLRRLWFTWERLVAAGAPGADASRACSHQQHMNKLDGSINAQYMLGTLIPTYGGGAWPGFAPRWPGCQVCLVWQPFGAIGNKDGCICLAGLLQHGSHSSDASTTRQDVPGTGAESY